MPDFPSPEQRHNQPERPQEERKDKDEKLVRELATHCQKNDREETEAKINALNAEQKKTLTESIARIFKEDPKTLNDHLRWHSCAAVLSMLDPKLHADFQRTILQQLKSTLYLLEKETFKGRDTGTDQLQIPKDWTDPLVQLDGHLGELFKLIAVQTTPDGKRLCIEKFSEWERLLNQHRTNEIVPFLERQIEIAKKVETDSLRPNMKKAMKSTFDGFANKNKYPNVRAAVKEENEEYFYTSKNKDGKSRTWKVEIYSGAAPLLMFRSTDKGEPGLLFTIDLLDGADALENDIKQIDAKSDQAVIDYEQEKSKEQQETLAGYDLPKDRPIAHIRLFTQSHDGIVSKGLLGSILLSSTLTKRYKDTVTVRPPLFSNEPEKALRQEIQDALKANGGKPLHLCVDIFSHGERDHFVFAKKLKAGHLIQIAKDFPQCTFTYNTIACYGAGMMKDTFANETFLKDKELQSRLAIFTQSKGDIPNVPAMSTAVTMYYVHFMKALGEGKTYGEAHRIADIEVKKYLPVDAEAIIKGMRLVMDKSLQPENNASV